MKFIPTTATAVEKIKSLARDIKSQEGVSHSKSLELAAERNGYDNWHHVNWCLSERSKKQNPRAPDNSSVLYGLSNEAYLDNLSKFATVPVVRHQPKGNYFHDVEIEGVRFRAGLAGGPYVNMLYKNRYETLTGSVELGVAGIYLTDKTTLTSRGQYAWRVCKYSSVEARIDLSLLSSEGICTFAKEFGLYILRPTVEFSDEIMASANCQRTVVDERSLFYLSPAFKSLCGWAKSHPRKIQSFDGNSYLGDWVGAAIEGAKTP